eukprot:6175656-Amphidinium_carterae.1
MMNLIVKTIPFIRKLLFKPKPFVKKKEHANYTRYLNTLANDDNQHLYLQKTMVSAKRRTTECRMFTKQNATPQVGSVLVVLIYESPFFSGKFLRWLAPEVEKEANADAVDKMMDDDDGQDSLDTDDPYIIPQAMSSINDERNE